MNALVVMMAERRDDVYGLSQIKQIREITNLIADPMDVKALLNQPELLEEVDILFGGWGMPKMDEAFLNLAPNLSSVFYAAGTVKSFVTENVWSRGIRVSSAASENAVPVAEYCLATILLSLKSGFGHMRAIRETQTWHRSSDIRGAYKASVGLIGYGVIAKLLFQHLRRFDLNVKVYCPLMSQSEAIQQGIQLATIDEIVETCDVVSIHVPELPETCGLIHAEHVRRMKVGATLINTARGSVIDEQGIFKVLKERSDVTAIIDVLTKEPPVDGAVDFNIPNLFITPHIAGAIGSERRRLGQFAVDECRRYLAGEPLLGEVCSQNLTSIA